MPMKTVASLIISLHSAPWAYFQWSFRKIKSTHTRLELMEKDLDREHRHLELNGHVDNLVHCPQKKSGAIHDDRRSYKTYR